MQLAKSVIDVGLSTNNLEPMLRFWQQDVAVRFDHVLPVRRGQKQYRHDEQGSVIKLNHHGEPLPEAAPSGYRELIIAREGLQEPRRMVDPDGNRVQLVPPGFDGVTQLGVAMGVRTSASTGGFTVISSASPSSPARTVRPFAWETACFFSRKTAPPLSIRFVRRAAGATSPCRSPISTPCMMSCEARVCAKALHRSRSGTWRAYR
jgi:hypothetical protein